MASGHVSTLGAAPWSDALRALHHNLRPGALPRLVRELAHAVDGEVALLDGAGRTLAASTARDLPSLLGTEIERVAARRAQAAATDLGEHRAEVLSVGESAPYAVLVMVRAQPFTPALHALAADAGLLMWLRWRLDALVADERRLFAAERHVRQAVLQLLMSGEVGGARRAAGALTPPLPDTVRVYIMQCATGRDQVADQCARATAGQAWIVRCPVYHDHLIILARAAEQARDHVQQALRDLARERATVRVGISRDVGLPQTPVGYQQAMHALAAARSDPSRAALFNPGAELADVLGREAAPWAKLRLRPLQEYRPDRQGDPDAQELKSTLRLWLGFGGGAAALLSIHRNTLTARLHRIESLLGHGLSGIGAQAELTLALRVSAARYAEPETATEAHAGLDTLLTSPEPARWADLWLAPLQEDAHAALLETVRVWLQRDTRVEPTAATLGLSVPGVRKRLARVEQLLQRSLLTGPSAAGDLHFALRSQDLRAAAAR